MELKQVILVRTDLKLPKGKMAAQSAHASVDAVLKSDISVVKSWRNQGMKKVVLKVENEKELVRFFQNAKDQGFASSLITDAGRTVVEPGTKTCVGIGPDIEEKIDLLTGNLKIM
ncbi:aminoacyl-tRNA hydrolase [Candidatus Woesearchaeota archaeon]|nr:MAG: aminoacyl-tRNA hydrolase [Candidatus Woesearchaeota archaeon]